MAKIYIKNQNHTATVHISQYVPTQVTPSQLISTDTPNDLKLGTDHKLLSQPDDVDFVAYYILSKN